MHHDRWRHTDIYSTFCLNRRWRFQFSNSLVACSDHFSGPISAPWKQSIGLLSHGYVSRCWSCTRACSVGHKLLLWWNMLKYQAQQIWTRLDFRVQFLDVEHPQPWATVIAYAQGFFPVMVPAEFVCCFNFVRWMVSVAWAWRMNGIFRIPSDHSDGHTCKAWHAHAPWYTLPSSWQMWSSAWGLPSSSETAIVVALDCSLQLSIVNSALSSCLWLRWSLLALQLCLLQLAVSTLQPKVGPC